MNTEKPVEVSEAPQTERSASDEVQIPNLNLYSSVLREMPRNELPETVCIECPHAIWQQTGTNLMAYCRVMYRDAWSKANPTQLLACDGTTLGQEEG